MNHTISTSLLALALAVPGTALADRFYLSTDRVFAPGQDVTVNVEAQSVAALQLRLYRLADPAAWFDAQDDLHRPTVEHAAPRPKTWSLLARGLRHGLQGAGAEVREALGRGGRRALKGAFEPWNTAVRVSPSESPAEKVLPPLAEHVLVDTWEQALATSDGWTYDTLAVPVREPGAYLLEASSGESVATTVVLVSDVALVTKQTASELLVWAVDPATGAPQADVAVTVMLDGKTVASGKTGKDGLGRYSPGLVERLVVYGQRGSSFTLLDPRFFASNLPEPRVYLFTERPVYRPGQELSWKGFARLPKADAYAPMSGREVKVEVRDPEGTVWDTTQATTGERGSFDGSYTLPDEPKLGTWQIVATIDGQQHAGQFKVMAFVKPEVRLTVRPDSKAVVQGERLTGDVVGQYFFGAPYPGAEVKLTLTRTRFYVPWWVDADYRWYYSDAEYRNTAREALEESKCTLDAKGECPFAFDTKVEGTDHTYVVEATALDPAARTVTGSAQIAVTTGRFRLAIEPGPLVVTPGAAREVVVRAVDYAGKPVKTSVTLRVEAERVVGESTEKVQVFDKAVAAGDDGRARFAVDVARGGYYRLSASAKDEAGHEIEAEGFVFASEGKGDLPFAPSELELVTDKQSYFAGETALVLVLAPAPEAEVLFTVEGTALHRAEVLKATRHALVTKVQIGAAQTPNFFLAATAVVGGQVFTKQRSVIVPPREKLLKVEVAPDRADAEPGQTVSFTVHVTDHTGQPVAGAELALAVVDEAIYAISPELAVPLESFYYPRKRNDVRSQDSVTFRFFGSSRGGETARRWSGDGELAYGSLKPQLDDVRKVFKDTAAWAPTLITDGQGKATSQVTLPDNLTAWRATARVMTAEGRVGAGTGSVRARKPLMLSVALPARLVEGDEGSGAVVVQNLSGKALELTLKLSAGARPMAMDPTPAGLTLSAVPGTLSVGDGESRRIPFTYTASGSGDLSVRAEVAGGGLKDGVESVVPVGEWATLRRVVAQGRTGGATKQQTHTLTVPDGARPEETQLRLELVSSPIAAIQGVLPYLVDYPYGCTEQTLSRFVPLLAAKAAMDTLKVDAGPQAKELPAMVEAGLARLTQLQHEDGGWGWWENDNSDVWMTAWALEGLAEAKALGAQPDAQLMSRGVAALERLLAETEHSDRTRAYGALALARHGKPAAGMLQQLAEASDPATLAQLVRAASLAGKAELVRAGVDKLATLAHRESGLVWWGASAADEAGEDEVEATSLVVLALVEAKAARDDVRAASTWLMSAVDEERLGSTRQTALAVRALAASVEAVPSGGATVIVRAEGREIAREVFDARRRSAPLVKLSPALALTSRTLTLEVEHQGEGEVAHTLALVAPVRAKVLSAGGVGGLSVRRAYYAVTGAPGAYTLGKPAARFAPGDTVVVKLDVESSRTLTHVLVEDPHTAGLSAVSSDSGMQLAGVDLRPAGVRRELRDDRAAFFVGSLPKGRTSLYYLARAGLGGSYHVLPTRAEAMYVPSAFHAQSTSAEVEVRGR
jgi:uncharacterized protein YfaS (alpha-2-macroglobulin family)